MPAIIFLEVGFTMHPADSILIILVVNKNGGEDTLLDFSRHLHLCQTSAYLLSINFCVFCCNTLIFPPVCSFSSRCLSLGVLKAIIGNL